MGINGLNKFLMTCSQGGISEQNLAKYKEHTFAIDTSIFLYKFMYSGKFIDSFIQQIKKLRKFSITPIYIFDGAPPKEKQDTIEDRKIAREKILNKIESITEQLSDINITEEDKKKLEKDKNIVEKRLITITRQDVINLKRTFDILGVKYIQANCEADLICCHLYKSGRVQGCISNDMDFLPSGCGLLLRNYNNSNIISEYNLKKILESLQISYDQFVDFCILCGCDYTIKIPKMGPKTSYNYIKKHNTIEEIIQNYCGEGKKFELPNDFDYKMARAMIKNGNTNNITVNLDNLVIENRNFNFNKEKILSSDFSDLQEDIDFLKNVAKISTKQTENRIRTLFLSY